MNFLDYLHLLRRHLISAILCTVLVVGATLCLVLYKNTAPYETTVFISIGNSQNTAQGNESVYENVQAADHFSETVQGWFKNPQFQGRLKMRSSSEMSARKQEKQNLIVTFTSEQAEEGRQGSEKLKIELDKEIADYNVKTDSRFQIAVYSFDTKHKPLSVPLFILISLIGGAMLSSFALYGFEYLFEKVSIQSQAAEVFERKPLDLLPSMEPKNAKLHFLSAHLKRDEGKNIQIIGIGIDVHKLAKSLEHLGHGKNIHPVNFPQESDKISVHDHQLAVCALGRTTLGDLRKIRTLLSASFDYIIVEA